jgi:fibronectin-binding autotransporter adhesin
MEALRGVDAPDRTVAGVSVRVCAMALAVAWGLGLAGCGGGGGGNGNVKTTPPATTPPPIVNPPPTGGSTPSDRNIDVAANAVTGLPDTVSGALNLIKGGAGTLNLTGNNSYTGKTMVNAGSLYVDGDQSAATGATTAASGATLGGNGTLGGDVTVADGGTLAPGAQGAIGTLVINGSLSLSSGSLLAFDFGQISGGTQASDLVNVKGNLVLDGTLNVAVPSGGDLGPGVHRLFNYGGALVDNGLTLGTMPSNGWAVQTGVANQVNLVDTRGMSFSFWDGDAGPKNNNVINGGDGIWNAGTSNTSWTDASGAINAPYSNGSFAVFQGTPGTVTVSDANGIVATTGMQFASYGYVIQGDGIHLTGSAADPTHSIIRVGDGTADGALYKATINSALDGTTTLVKTDSGKLVLAGNNIYSGGTIVSGGTLQVGDGSTSGWILGDVTNNASLAFNRSDNVSYNGIVSGSGALLQAGTGKLTLTGVNTYTGGTVVSAGTLEIATGAMPGTGDITVGSSRGNFASAYTLQVDGGVALSNHILLTDHGVLDNAGVLGGNVNVAVDAAPLAYPNPTVRNHDGGRITGNHAGVSLAGYQSVLTNSSGGVIDGGDIGVYSDGGTLTNDGTGSIIRSAGIAVNMASGSITNRGGANITGGDAALSFLYGGGDGVSNDGVGSSITSTNGYAIRMLGDTGRVTNTGGATISSGKTAVSLLHGGSVTNGVGSIIETTGAPGGDCAAAGNCAIVVTSAANTAYNLGGSLTLNNAGTIIGNVQMIPTASNTVTLTSGGSIHGDLDIGSSNMSFLTLNGAPGSVQLYSQAVTGKSTFSGFMVGPSAGTWVIDNNDLAPRSISIAGGTLQIGTGGTVGSLGQPAEIDIYHGSLIFNRSDNVTFDGSITSQHSEAYDGSLVQAGTGTLTLVLGNHDISPSRILIQSGTLQIDNTADVPGASTGWYPLETGITNNGSLVFSSALTLTAGSISGTGSITKNGAAELDLLGANTYAGGLTINNGSVMANHVLPGDVTVNPLGLLDGYTGATLHPGVPGVGGNLFNAGKIPVHRGDTTVGGNYTQSSTGTLAVSLGSKIAVTGTATLNGGTLEITGADSGYVSNAHTNVLTAAGGLTGTFNQLVKDTGVVFTSTTINYDANSAWLDTAGLNVTTAAAGNGVSYTPTSFRSAQRVQAAFTQLNDKVATGSLSSVPNDFVQAAGQFQQAPTLQAAQASLQSLSGELHAASAAMTFEAIDASSHAMSDRFDDLAEKKMAYGMWTHNVNAGGDMVRAGYDGVGFQLNGWLVGNDRPIGNSGVAGFAFGQTYGQQQLDRSYDRNRGRNTEGMFYAGWLNGSWYSQGRVGFGYFTQDVNRLLQLGTSMQGVSTNYNGNYTVAYGESGLHLNWNGSRVTPFANVEYANIARGGFAEQGAGGFGLRSNSQTIDRWQAGLGVRASHHWAFDGGRSIELNASGRFQRTLATRGDVFDASFVGLQQWQPLAGIGLSRYSGVFNVGLDAALSERTGLKFGYDYEKGQRDQAQTVSARVVMAL